MSDSNDETEQSTVTETNDSTGIEALTSDFKGLDDVVDEAERRREEAKASIVKLRAVEEELHRRADLLLEQDYIDPVQRSSIDESIEEGWYGAAREAIEEAAPDLEFTDDERRALAVACGDVLEEILAEVELIRNALSKIADKGWDRDDLVAFLYGSNSSLNKGEIRACFDVIGDTASTDVDVDDMAAYIAHKTADVDIDAARAFIWGLQEAQTKDDYEPEEPVEEAFE